MIYFRKFDLRGNNSISYCEAYGIETCRAAIEFSKMLLLVNMPYQNRNMPSCYRVLENATPCGYALTKYSRRLPLWTSHSPVVAERLISFC